MDNTYSWQNAQDVFIAQLNSDNFGGHTDWRLPTIKELSTLVNADAITTSINTAYFPQTMSSFYWSSTTDVSSTGYAWYVYFNYGFIDNGGSKASSLYVRAVRGGQ